MRLPEINLGFVARYLIGKLLFRRYQNLYRLYHEKRVSAELDPDFTIESFKQGATIALLAVTDILASDDIRALKEKGFLSASTYQVVKAGHDKLSSSQRRKLRFREQDIGSENRLKSRIIQDKVTGVRAVEILLLQLIAVRDPAAIGKIIQMDVGHKFLNR